MPFSNPILGGDTLVRNAIQSANYVAGVSGWAIFRDGSAEFNNITVRGTFEAGGGAVRLNAGGLHISGAGVQFDINITAGFLARNDPDNGVTSQMSPGLISTTGSILNTTSGMLYSASQLFTVFVGVAVGNTAINSGFINYPIAFPVGSILFGICNITNAALSGVSNSSQWHARWVGQDNTKFGILAFCPGGAPAAINLTINVHVWVL